MWKPAERDKKVRRVILIEGAANLAVLITKAIVGFSTGSMAILADAVHSLSDLANNVIAWVVMHFSSQPADIEHPYGHRKFETLAVFVLASILVVLAIQLAINTISREPEAVASSRLELGLMLGVLVVNIVVTTWQHGWAKRLDSDILRADASHTFADVLVTGVVIIGWQLSAMGYLWLDKLCALAVSLLVIYLAYNLFRRAIPVLLDSYAVDPQEIRTALQAVDGVESVRRVRSRWIGKQCAIDLVITVDPGMSTEQSHRIADQVEGIIERRFNSTDVSIHVEPESTL